MFELIQYPDKALLHDRVVLRQTDNGAHNCDDSPCARVTYLSILLGACAKCPAGAQSAIPQDRQGSSWAGSCWQHPNRAQPPALPSQGLAVALPCTRADVAQMLCAVPDMGSAACSCAVLTGMYVTVHNFGFWIEAAGNPTVSRPSVLLLHGFPDSSKLWSSQVSALAAAGYHVIAPDMLGYGRSDKPTDAKHYALRNIVILLCALLDKLGVPGKVVVVGHDWGAATAWAMALQVPHRVDRLVVLSVGHPGAAAAVDPRQRAHWWYMLFFLLPGAEEALQANDWALFRLVMGAGCSEQQVQQYQEQLSQPGALTAALNWYRANTSALHFGQTQPWAATKPLKFPVLGVWSTKDTALQEPQMLASEQFVGPGCWHYVRLEGVGHWMPREAAELINQLLLDFMATADGAAAVTRQDAIPVTQGVDRGSRSRL